MPAKPGDGVLIINRSDEALIKAAGVAFTVGAELGRGGRRPDRTAADSVAKPSAGNAPIPALASAGLTDPAVPTLATGWPTLIERPATAKYELGE